MALPMFKRPARPATCSSQENARKKTHKEKQKSGDIRKQKVQVSPKEVWLQIYLVLYWTKEVSSRIIQFVGLFMVKYRELQTLRKDKFDLTLPQ